MKRAEVFTPNQLPVVTLVSEHLLTKQKQLQEHLEQGGAVVAISGPSKSGKTVFVETTLGQGNLVQVTGANIGEADDLWRRILSAIGTPIPASKTTTAADEATYQGSIEGGVPGFGKATAALGGKSSNAVASTVDVKPDYLALLVKELRGTEFVVFIDDFHYIPEAIQTQIAEVIKEAIREGLKFVLAAVPYHADDVVIANADLRGRMLKLDFDYWDPGELAKIAEKGFAALNTTVTNATVTAFATEAGGSPQLMQALCLNLCFEVDLRETAPEPMQVNPNQQLIDTVCRRTANTNDYSSAIRVMKEGPKIRGTERNSYLLKDGEIKDVYPILVRAISSNPPELTLSYPNLLARIASVCAKDHPSGSSVTGACSHMAELANLASNASILEWDGTHDVLDIRDPYLLFALRWAEMA